MRAEGAMSSRRASLSPGDSESGAICDDGRGVGVLVTVGVRSSSIGMKGVDAGVFESRASARLDHRDGVTA